MTRAAGMVATGDDVGRVVRVLLVSGSLRSGSTNTAALLTARAVAPPGIDSELWAGMGQLPHFNPDDDVAGAAAGGRLDPAVVALREAVGRADAVLFSTPEYAGELPGSFKNLLDWTVGGGEIYQKPVGWVNVSGSPTGAAGAYRALRTVLGYVGAHVVEAACVHLPVARADVGPDGLVDRPVVRQGLAAVLSTLAAPGAAGTPA